MSTAGLLKLDLRFRKPRTVEWRPLVTRALDVMADALATSETNVGGMRLAEGVEQYKRRFLEADGADALLAVGDDFLHFCARMLDEVRNHRVKTQSELASLVTLVRQAVVAVAGDGQAFSAGIEHSAARLKDLAAVDNLALLKKRLTEEVSELQRIVVERQSSWQATVATFESRIALLTKELAASQEEASLDPLTGVANRRTFDDVGQRWLRTGRRQFVVALFDLDDFKQINDGHGHGAGDRVLAMVAQVLKTSVRSADVVARIGGDEFALLIQGITLPQSERLVRSIMGKLSASADGSEGPPPVTLSCGVAEYSAGDTLESLMQRADRALYDAKRQGKHRVVANEAPFIRDQYRH